MNGFVNTIDELGEREFAKQYFGKSLTEYYDDSVTILTTGALRNFPSLSRVVLPNCSSIITSAFYECKNLSYISLPNLMSFYDYSKSIAGIFAGTGVNSIDLIPKYYSSYIPVGCFRSCNFSGTLSIPGKYTMIGESAFQSNPIEKLVIEHSCSVFANAFAYCVDLKEVSAPGLKSVAASAFERCGMLETFFAPELSGAIPVACFSNCSALTNVTNFEKVTGVYTGAFFGCRNLPSISFRVASTILSSVFYGCSALSVIYIGSDTCTLSTSYAFQSTKITFATGSIYVPASRVDYYRNSTNWNWFSTQIKGYDYENDRPVD